VILQAVDPLAPGVAEVWVGAHLAEGRPELARALIERLRIAAPGRGLEWDALAAMRGVSGPLDRTAPPAPF
jgi:hypothetical protein